MSNPSVPPTSSLHSRCFAALDRATHQQQTFIRPWYRTFDEQDIPLGIHAHHAQILDRHPFVTHVPSHPLSLEDAAWRGGRANRTWGAATI